MMFTGSSLIVLGLGILILVLSGVKFGGARKEISEKLHRKVCFIVFVLGFILRLVDLGGLPEGVFAEEALVGVQAKSLWQTGGFLFHNGLTTQLQHWAGESTGPLLATLTAPFVGLFGMSTFVVRLPLTVLSCVAMLAAYGLGNMIGGKRMGRWCLTAYAICPYFVLMARLTCGANVTVYLLPIALYAMVAGVKSMKLLYMGAILMGLMAYGQNMYFFIAPAVIVASSVVAAIYGMKKRHAIGAAILGLLISLPAMLTLWVNLSAVEGFELLGLVEIPKLENFDKADSLMDYLVPGGEMWDIQNKVWTIVVGAFFQVLAHMNISAELFAPTGMGALYILSVPLMALGGFVVIHSIFRGRKCSGDKKPGCVLLLMVLGITQISLMLYGSVGYLDNEGCTSVFDYSALLFFDVLLMAVGLSWLEKKSCAGIAGMTMLMTTCTVLLCVHLFAGSYEMNANVFFAGFEELAVKAKKESEVSWAKVHVTGTVYPHITPSDAAEIMYLYSTDADMTQIAADRNNKYEVIYAPSIENPDPQQIYLLAENDALDWDYSQFEYEEKGEFILLTPKE